MREPPHATHPDLAELRAALDVCNRRLAAVLHERAGLVRAVAARKRAVGAPIADPAREATMLAAVAEFGAKDGFPIDALQRIFAAVFAESRALAERG